MILRRRRRRRRREEDPQHPSFVTDPDHRVAVHHQTTIIMALLRIMQTTTTTIPQIFWIRWKLPPIRLKKRNPAVVMAVLRSSSSSNNSWCSQRFNTAAAAAAAATAKRHLSPEDPPKIRNPSNAGADLVFDPQRSPKSQADGMSPPQLTNSLDMAPSFSLFNQSLIVWAIRHNSLTSVDHSIRPC